MNNYYFQYDRKGTDDGRFLSAKTDMAAMQQLKYAGKGTLVREMQIGNWVEIFKRKKGNWTPIKGN